jgi:hypothetical protein
MNGMRFVLNHGNRDPPFGRGIPTRRGPKETLLWAAPLGTALYIIGGVPPGSTASEHRGVRRAEGGAREYLHRPVDGVPWPDTTTLVSVFGPESDQASRS